MGSCAGTEGAAIFGCALLSTFPVPFSPSVFVPPLTTPLYSWHSLLPLPVHRFLPANVQEDQHGCRQGCRHQGRQEAAVNSDYLSTLDGRRFPHSSLGTPIDSSLPRSFYLLKTFAGKLGCLPLLPNFPTETFQRKRSLTPPSPPPAAYNTPYCPPAAPLASIPQYTPPVSSSPDCTSAAGPSSLPSFFISPSRAASSSVCGGLFASR